ncbi:hypothetical protein J3F84DRAFT_31083 [Trichoderma pleuroticola]
MANELMNPASLMVPRADLSNEERDRERESERENDDRVVAACDVSFHQRTDKQRWHLLRKRHHTSPGEESVPPSHRHMPDRWPADNRPGSRLLFLISRGAACMFLLCMAKCVTWLLALNGIAEPCRRQSTRMLHHHYITASRCDDGVKSINGHARPFS